MFDVLWKCAGCGLKLYAPLRPNPNGKRACIGCKGTAWTRLPGPSPVLQPRCCGRWCFWRMPFGPWVCTVCDRQHPANDVPAAHRGRFWEAVGEMVRAMDAFALARPAALADLDVFRTGKAVR